MIRKKLSKLPDSAAMGRTMIYALKKAALVGGSEVKFEGTSIKDYVKLAVKKCDQVNNKYEAKTGRKQEVKGLHEMISFDASDDVSPEKAAELALNVWREVLDIDNHRHRWAVHTDTDKIHVHLIWNKRDNGGKVYEQLHDYALFEKALHKTEIENGLKVVENRKFLKPGMPTNPQPSNEYRLENRGIKSEKTKFKEAVTSATDKAMTAGEFLEFLDADGFTLITNGNNAYSIEKDGVIFKASEVGASYKLLKARFGDDPQFSATLALLHKEKPQNDDAGSITAPTNEAAPTNQPPKPPATAPAPNYESEPEHEDGYSDYGSQSSNERRKERADFFKGVVMQKTLYANYHHDDKGNYYFNRNDKKAFEFDSSSNTVSYKTSTPSSVKAGLQKLTEDKNPCEIFLRGGENFKREMWLQFHLMKLDEKGYTLNGFKPSQQDLETLELKLSEQTKFYNGSKNDPLIEKQIEALTQKPEGKTILDKVFSKKETSSVGEDEKVKMDLENFTTFKVSDTKLEAKTDAEKSAQSGAAGVLAGAVEKLTDMTGSFSGGVQQEMLAEMAALDRDAKNKQQGVENEHHHNKRNRGPQYRP